jgi:signal transduction histidine kinase/ligand-binding sensor domain-containing protein/DNA-binding response OmpR family regulator
MNKMRKIFVSIITLLIAIYIPEKKTIASEQPLLNYRFEYLLIEDGLPQNTISAIERDQYGFMWFGTNNGISRYDGYTFESFKADDNEHGESLPDNMISSIKAGADNRVWIGSLNGLSYFDPMEGKIFSFDKQSGLSAISKVTAIEFYNNNLWVGTSNNGIFVLSKNENGEYIIDKHFCEQNKNLSNNYVSKIYHSKSNKLFIGTQTEALVFLPKTGQFVSIIDDVQLPQNIFVNDIFESSTGDIYLSSFYGLAIYFNNSNAFTWLYSDPLNKRSIIHNTVSTVNEDMHGNILVGSLGGLQYFNPVTLQFTTFPEARPGNFRLNNKFISDIYCDSTGNVWIGTEKGGINKFNVNQKQFNYYAHDPNNPNSINENTINSVLKEKNDLWIGTADGGLNRINFQSGKITHYTYDLYNTTSISSNYITSLTRDNNGFLWAGSWGGGLNKIDTRRKNVNISRIDGNSAGYTNEIVNYFVAAIKNDERGFLLAGTEGGLSILDYSTNTFTTLTASPGSNPPLSEIGCIMSDSNGYYWIGTRNGLFRFPTESIKRTNDEILIIDNLLFYENEPGDSTSIPGNYIISLLEDSKGYVWIGTYGNGITRCKVFPDGQIKFKTYTQADGLSNNVAYGIEEDEDGNIWISTDYGLSMLDPESGHFKNYYKQDGLLNNQFYWSASHKSYDGELYFGGTEGLNYFKPGNIKEFNYTPKARVTKLRVHNHEINPGKKLNDKTVISKPIYTADSILLSYRDNNISFDFSSFDYYLPEKTKFAYRLSDIDQDWITVPSQRRFANYNNLSGGTYTFELKATNSDGIWHNEPTRLTIIITPPFWKTKWFLILTIVFVVLSTFLLVQLQMRRIIQQKRLLEEKVHNRTQEIEKQNIVLENQATELLEKNKQLERRQKQIEQQKEELENKNNEISVQRDELIKLNEKVKEINQQQLRFFTNISHEFRTPLTLIISPIERLARKLAWNPETSNILSIVNRNAQRLLLLINQLLEIRKIETGNQELQVEMTETEHFLDEVFRSFEELAARNKIRYIKEFDVNKVSWIDKEKLENVLYNLLSNAFKFTPEGSEITLKARTVKDQNTYYLKIFVIDTGIGIPTDQHKKLFDRFYQVTETKNHVNRGTGIGLSMVKSLANIMYGTIEVDSFPGKGSEFTITIPVNKSAFAEHEIDKSGQTFESSLKERVAILHDQLATPEVVIKSYENNQIDKILIVEDNADMRSFICSSLTGYYTVLEAGNGKEGYELAKKEEPSMIISDIMMPELDGIEMLKKIKNNLYTSHIPIILLTAKSKLNDVIEGIGYGADDYIAKPFNVELLIAKSKNLIETRKKLRNRYSALEEVPASELTNSNLDNSFFEKVNRIVEKYYTDPSFDVDHFASAMFVSRSQLYKKLKAITNLSANDFINVYRLKKSTELLRNGNMQVSEIAFATGFNDPKYFSRIFKKFYQCSPSEYVKKENNQDPIK